MIANNPDALSLALALGGLVGSGLRVLLTQNQTTWSRKSIGDILIGGAVGFLWPLYPLIDFPTTATLLQKAAIVGTIAYFASDVLQNGLARVLGALRPPPDAPK